jgi:predicted N-acetyltransferase YhbS
MNATVHSQQRAFDAPSTRHDGQALDVLRRPARQDDAQACGAICFAAFRAIAEQHNFPPDFPSADVAAALLSNLIADPNVYSVVAERDGHVLGSNFLWEHSIIAGIGPITVDPAAQNSHVGRLLMNDALDRARERGFAGVRLVQAAYHQRSLSLYTKLGFDAREPLSVLQGRAIGLRTAAFPVRAARATDLDACNRLMLRVHGHERGKELLHAIAEGTATVVEREGRITGYATLIGFFGHAIAETNDDLKALIAAAPSFAGPGFLLPTRNAELFRWCLANGLRVVQPMTLMSIGLYNEPVGTYLPSVLF